MLLGDDRRQLVEHGISHAVLWTDGARHGIAIVNREARRLRVAMIVHGYSSSLAGDSFPLATTRCILASASSITARTGGLAVIPATRSMRTPVTWATIAAITGTQKMPWQVPMPAR